jgi:hypothetical protein
MALITNDSDDGRASPEAQKAALIAAYQRELAGYLATGRTERADQVRAELRRLGVKDDADKPVRADKPAKAETEKPQATEQATA